jgi:hypothetical protein
MKMDFKTSTENHIIAKKNYNYEISDHGHSLAHLTDQALHADFCQLAKSEREILSQVLRHIQEVHKRKLFSTLGYNSLFDYLTRGLKYSEGSAQRRISAARLASEVPEVLDFLQEGSLTLAQTGLVQSLSQTTTAEVKVQILQEIKNKDIKQTERILETNQHIKDEKKKNFKLEVDEEIMELLKELNHFSNLQDQKTQLKKALKNEIERRKKVKFKTLGTKEINQMQRSEKAEKLSQSAAIPSEVKRLVAQRDHQRCSNCGSRHQLQFDHRFPRSMGGKNTAENIRLLCFHCNQRARLEMKLTVKKLSLPNGGGQSISKTHL